MFRMPTHPSEYDDDLPVDLGDERSLDDAESQAVVDLIELQRRARAQGLEGFLNMDGHPNAGIDLTHPLS